LKCLGLHWQYAYKSERPVLQYAFVVLWLLWQYAFQVFWTGSLFGNILFEVFKPLWQNNVGNSYNKSWLQCNELYCHHEHNCSSNKKNLWKAALPPVKVL
jgi:hypothetical protein